MDTYMTTKGSNEITAVSAPHAHAGAAYQRCYHGGHKTLWTMPNGHGVYAAQEAELAVCTGHGVILDCTGYTNKQTQFQRDAAKAKLAEETLLFEGADYLATLAQHIQRPTPRVHIAWPDGGEPPLAPSFWKAFLDTVQGSVCVCCHGSHGRTGTALASLYMAQHAHEATDLTLAEVVATIRRRHCHEAVETLDQVMYLEAVADAYGVIIDATEIQPSYSYRAVSFTPKANGTNASPTGGPSDVLGATRAVVNGVDVATGIRTSVNAPQYHANGERAKQANGNTKRKPRKGAK